MGLLFLNVQGLSSKCDIIENYIKDLDCCDCLCFTEHWLDKTSIDLASINGFYLASYFSRSGMSRGGTAIYVSDKVKCRTVPTENFCIMKHFEVCSVIIDTYKIIVVCVYHTPDGDVNTFLKRLNDFLNYLEYFWPNHKICFGGDLNSKFDVTTSKTTVTELLNLMRQHNLYYCNDQPTRGSACLDNVFSNFNHLVSKVLVHPFLFSDHDAVVVQLNLKTSNCSGNFNNKHGGGLSSHIIFKRSFTHNNYVNFLAMLESANWDSIYSQSMDAESCCITFFEKILHTFNYCFKLKSFTARSGFSSKNSLKSGRLDWYTDELKNMKSRLMMVYNSYKDSPSERVKILYQFLKKQYGHAIKEAKKLYNSDKIASSSNKCKAAWDIIKHSNNSSSAKKPQSLPFTADCFNDFFVQSVSTIRSKIGNSNLDVNVLTQNCVDSLSSHSNAFSFKEISCDNVLTVVKNMKSSDSVDVYDMSSKLIKSVIDPILEPLTLCFNYCLQQGVFPNFMKLSKVRPIFKKGEVNDLGNYRPISLIPVLAKIFEYLIFRQISTYFESSGLLSNCQFGFRKGRSTIDAIDELVRELFRVLERKGFAWVTFCDLSKAFDCVDHDLLLGKLKLYGINGTSLQLFKSYLKNRRQKVMVGKDWSEEVVVSNGVPQGSVLGPFLFLIYINDLPSNVRANTFMYADDTSILSTDYDYNNLVSNVKLDVSDAEEWFKANKLLLNADKTQNVVVTLRDMPNDSIDSGLSPSVKFLGVMLDSSLNWSSHINYILPKICRTVFLLRKLVNCIPIEYVRSSYFAFFQSHIRYGLLIWGGSNKIQSVLIVQKNAIRVMSSAAFNAHCRPLFIKLQILTVVNLYIFDAVMYTFKRKANHVTRSDIHLHDTRNKHLLDIEFYRLEKTKNMYIVLGPKFVNHLPKYVQELDLDQCKNRLYDWLILNPFYSFKEFFSIHTNLIEI